MLGNEFRRIRKALGLSMDQFALALGYDGKAKNNRTTMQRFESGERPISPPIARLAWMIEQHGVPNYPDNIDAGFYQEGANDR